MNTDMWVLWRKERVLGSSWVSVLPNGLCRYLSPL